MGLYIVVGPDLLLVVPRHLRLAMLQQLHNSATVGHLGVTRRFSLRRYVTAYDLRERQRTHAVPCAAFLQPFPRSHFSMRRLTCLAFFLFPRKETSGLQCQEIMHQDMPSGEQFQSAALEVSVTMAPLVTSLRIMAVTS